MKFDPSPAAIWRKFERDRDYKRSIGLYDRVRRNEAFYLGRQWEGLRVQSLDPLIFNVLRRCVNLFVSMLVSDDVAVRAKEVMEILDITKNLMYKLIHNDEIHAFRIGEKKWMIRKDILIKYIENH